MDEHDSRVILTSGGTKKNLFTVFMIFFIYLKLEYFDHRDDFLLQLTRHVFKLFSSVKQWFSVLRIVYPSLEQYSIEKAEGVSEAGFRGISKRKSPLPFAIPSTGKQYLWERNQKGIKIVERGTSAERDESSIFP